jgi:hypothetical protein
MRTFDEHGSEILIYKAHKNERGDIRFDVSINGGLAEFVLLLSAREARLIAGELELISADSKVLDAAVKGSGGLPGEVEL